MRRYGRVRSIALLLPIVATTMVSATASARESRLAEMVAPDTGVTLSFVPVFSGLREPLFVTHAGDGTGRVFIVGRWGTIWVAGGNLGAPEVFLDITGIVRGNHGEQGLLGLAFAPDYPASGRFYVYYTDKEARQVVARYRVSADPNRADPASGEPLLVMPDRAPNHNGGMLAFGPDGYLYIGTGDEGGSGDTYRNGQNLTSLLGKILRIDVSVAEGYAIPPDNPFVGVEGARPEIWAWGLRNPWRFSFDRLTGDLFIGDVGQASWEEIDYHPFGTGTGANHGWPIMEATHCYPPNTSECPSDGLTLPIAEYSHADGCSVTGGYVYRGSAEPLLVGRYLFGDLCSGRIWALDRSSAGWTMQELVNTSITVASFGEDEAGELYVADVYNDTVYRLTTSDAVARTWQRTDLPVAFGAAARTWMWGPGPIAAALTETYLEAPGGARTVQYFDKARMEVTDPLGTEDEPWFVTNGLLVVEMVTRRVQLGDFTFQDAPPANINVAGDPDDPDGPTYATMGTLLRAPALADGAPVIQRLDRAGMVTEDPALAVYGVTAAWRVSVGGVQHQVASVFWEFLTSTGPVWEDGAIVDGPLFLNPFYATGYPITEAYWTEVRVAGTKRLVLLQCFERRCLTYTPGNPEGWLVEAGNVGQHYLRWRYPEEFD